MTDLPVTVLDVKARLGATQFNFDSPDHAHITIDQKICATCPHQMCMYSCPAGCFTPTDGGPVKGGNMTFQYEDCVECGTCDIVCTPGSVKWNNPRGGFGVKYRYG
jgi:ferredoxin like protein